MLSWVVTFLIIALIAGILGFGGIAGVSIEIAKAIFFIAVVLFLVSAVVGLARGRTRVWLMAGSPKSWRASLPSTNGGCAMLSPPVAPVYRITGIPLQSRYDNGTPADGGTP